MIWHDTICPDGSNSSILHNMYSCFHHGCGPQRPNHAIRTGAIGAR
jgi:hypothetical protein